MCIRSTVFVSEFFSSSANLVITLSYPPNSYQRLITVDPRGRVIQDQDEAGVKTVFLDLTKIGGQNVTAEQWYIGLLAETGRQLGLRKEFLAYWKENAEYST